MKNNERDLRFTGDSDDMHVLVPLSNDTFACRPGECPVVLTNHSAEDDIILECAHLLDMVESARGQSDHAVQATYWNVRSSLRWLIDAHTDCDPNTVTTQPYGALPRVTCPHGEFDSWKTYAMHAIQHQPETGR